MRTDVIKYPFSQYLNQFKFFGCRLSGKHKEHNLQAHENGCDYFLTVTDYGMTACMTIQGFQLRPQDHILVKIEGEVVRYSVEEIDYFAEPADACMVALRKIESRGENCTDIHYCSRVYAGEG
jgi:hypothetical protein